MRDQVSKVDEAAGGEIDGPRVRENGMANSYVAELLASAGVAIAVGLALRQV